MTHRDTDPPDVTGDDHHFREAAIEAEFETGRREATEAKAWHHVLVRLGRMGIGFAVTILGIIMLPLPGPGFLVIAVGLAVLSRDVAWADRLLHRVRDRLPADDDGKLPRSTIATMVVMTAAGIAFSIWLSMR
ncbi:MAG: PGPGW domain-containing protein [Actinomycetota bacterium]|jgi:uncharacterized protein (TIGR02611 family)|nr:PGPGW domain-containing protein [Actinomycetota bacterium]